MRRPRWVPGAVLATSMALVVTGCGGGGGEGDGSGSGSTDAGITVFNTEPENPLIPGNTVEVGGGHVIDSLFTGLLEYNGDTAAPENAMAESIESPDSKVYTIKIKPGWKFHNDTDVKAKNFVDAWNWTAYGPNATQGASFLAPIQGYSEVHPKDPDGASGPEKAPVPTVDKMSGLKVIDDQTFEVTLAEPFSVFRTMLGYSTFKPLPDAFFTDQKAFEANPIGNGPFKFVSRVVNTDIKLTRFDGYGGEKPKYKDLTWKVYQSREAAYPDLVNNTLDFMEELPPNALAGELYKSDLGDRAIEKETLNNQTLSFPLYQEAYKNIDLRKALSMAVNREEITQQIFQGTRTPADGLLHPLLPGYKPGGQCGELCTFNPTKAKELFAKSGFTGTLKILSNTDGGHQEWATAVANSIKNTLGVEVVFEPATSFGDFRQKVNGRQMSDMFRAGWVADYPHPENFLTPLYSTGASSNDGEYSNPAVDAKLKEADTAPTEAEGIAKYLEAEKMILEDMPSIPLWTQNTVAGKSDRLKVAKLHPFRKLDITSVEVA